MKAFTIDKDIILAELIGLPRNREFVRVGVPFSRGELNSIDDLSLVTPEEEEQPIQGKVLNQWDDGSVKWALLDFQATVPAGKKIKYRVCDKRSPLPDKVSPIVITRGDKIWQVNTGAVIFSLDVIQFRPFTCVKKAGNLPLSGEGSCALTTADDTRATPFVKDIIIESEGPLRAVIAMKGCFGESSAEAARFSSRLHFFAASSTVLIEFTIHNPNRARHPNGLWDLGDPGSTLFKELAFNLNFTNGAVEKIAYILDRDADWIHREATTENLKVYQESSGGERWLSPIHRNSRGAVPFKIQGYQLTQGNTVQAKGARARPVFWCGSGNLGISAALPRFWEEFPKAIEANRQFMKIALFPACFPDLHELQAGEQKTHHVYLDFCSQPGGLDWTCRPLLAVPSRRVVGSSGAIKEISGDLEQWNDNPDFVDAFISGPGEFLEKREIVDEYGWRNFGDVYADHEAVKQNSSQPFVSHYNNQYDICAGMYRKFLETADPLWHDLASDLARHVLDIDIYHTDRDRPEYNYGLFWHTDHYIDAGLSTHRSFSREHLSKKNPKYTGGGPGAEHCYTTGLMLHYFFTGDPAFRSAVINLAEWSYQSLSGSNTALGCLQRFLHDLKQARAANASGIVLYPRYPLTRATGNALNACLDAFELSSDKKYLMRAEDLIRNCLHPGDDLESRCLLDAENSWSYTVFLVSLSNFLLKLEELRLYDPIYFYARDCLLAYAQWMTQHEYPYLEKPEILEYPNETWAAQDMRKSVIFYHAARHAVGDQQNSFLRSARRFLKTAHEELSHHSTSRFTRPLALMLQNGWIARKLESPVTPAYAAGMAGPIHGTPTPSLSYKTVIHRAFGDLAHAITTFNPTNEFKWLNVRFENKFSR